MRDARAEAERWLAAAREDLEYARYAAAGGHHSPACFFAQQAAEKAIKGVHYLHGALAVIGHNLRALIEQLDLRHMRAVEPPGGRRRRETGATQASSCRRRTELLNGRPAARRESTPDNINGACDGWVAPVLPLPHPFCPGGLPLGLARPARQGVGSALPARFAQGCFRGASQR
jgi:hypothetical protein